MTFFGGYTLFRKEAWRFLSMPWEAIGPPVITTLLYFLIFGLTIGPRVGDISGLSYLEFILPGLITMNTAIYTYSNVAYSLQITKISQSMSDILASPISYSEIIFGYIFSSTLRGLITGILIYSTSLFFVPYNMEHPLYLIFFYIFSALMFSLFGLIVGLWSQTFEQVSIFPTFFLTPLSFLGGIFYSLEMLPPFWRDVSLYNPILYVINGIRYGFYGISDINPFFAIVIIFVTFLLFFSTAYTLLRSGYRIRT